MCGVRFMAETVKVLSPQKHAILANPLAGCPMAQQIDQKMISWLKDRYPEHTIVAYINTTSALKTAVDVCVTSSSAAHIINNIQNDKILFIPDKNLGEWVEKQCPNKQFAFFKGGCPTHMRMRKRDVDQARQLHPNAKLLVHPECLSEVTELADFAGSTTEIMAEVSGKVPKRNSSLERKAALSNTYNLNVRINSFIFFLENVSVII